MNEVQNTADKVFRQHFGKLVASLMYSSHQIDLETAEDLVQDAFSTAINEWSTHGIPLQPAGWIYRVCRNKALNWIRKKKEVAIPDDAQLEAVENRFSESALADPTLKLLFACAHPDLSPKAQVVITLKYVTNFKVETIARILGMTVDGVDKLLLRAREKIREEKILLEEPHAATLTLRLSSVHKVIYLIFNEGYKSSYGNEILRKELCEEALVANSTLLDIGLANGDTLALHSLMLFNVARFRSRFDPSGELLDLAQQDRSLWDRNLIELASDFLTRSQNETVSSFHIEASIACLHCTSPSFEQTDWQSIARLYSQLQRSNPNPFVALNYAIALFYAGEKQNAFHMLRELERHPFMSRYYLLNSTIGKFHHLQGADGLAKTYLQKALDQTSFEKEKNFIRQMIKALK